MATPITWRNVGQPSFDASGLNAAISGFDAAGRGFQDFGDSMMKLQALETKGMTNQAIADVLAGRTPSSDPRIDQGLIGQTQRREALTKSALETARLGQIKTGVETRQARLDYLQDPEKHRSDMEVDAANIRQSGAAANASDAQVRHFNELIKAAQLENSEKAALNQGGMDVDAELSAIAEQETQRLNEEFDTQTQPLFDQARTELTAKLDASKLSPGEKSAELQRLMDEQEKIRQERRQANYMQAKANAVNNASPIIDRKVQQLGTTWEALAGQSQFGAEAFAARKAAQETINARQQAADTALGFEKQYAEKAASGEDLAGIVLDPNAPGGSRMINNESQRNANVITSTEKWKSYINTTFPGVDIDPELSKELHTILGGNVSALEAVMGGQGVIEDGFFGGRTVNAKVANTTAATARKDLISAAQKYLSTVPNNNVPLSNADVIQRLQRDLADQAHLNAQGAGSEKEEPAKTPAGLPEPKDERDVSGRVEVFTQSLQDAQAKMKGLGDAVLSRHDYGLSQQLKAALDFATEGATYTGDALTTEQRAEQLIQFEEIFKKLTAAEAAYQAVQATKRRENTERDLIQNAINKTK